MRNVYQADDSFLYSFVSGDEQKMLVRIIQPFLVFATVILLFIITVRTIIFSFSSTTSKQCLTTDEDHIELSEKMLTNFQTSLRFKTVSYARGNYSREELVKFQKFIISCE